MRQILFSLNVVLPVFFTGAFGYYLRQKNIMSEEFVSEASRLCFTAFMPVMLFLQIYQADQSAGFDPLVFGYCFIGTLLVTALSFVGTYFFVPERERAGAVCQALFRSNIMALGFPILQNMYGSTAGVYLNTMMAPIVAVFNIAAVLSFTLFSPFSNQQKLTVGKVLKKVATNRYIIAMALAQLLLWLHIELPVALIRSAANVSALSVPLALITIGGQFSFSAAKGNLCFSLPTCFVRLVAIPVVMVTGAVLLGMRGEALVTTLVVFGCSTAVSCSAMAQSMEGDYVLAGDITLLSSLFSVFSIFAFVLVFGLMGWI